MLVEDHWEVPNLQTILRGQSWVKNLEVDSHSSYTSLLISVLRDKLIECQAASGFLTFPYEMGGQRDSHYMSHVGQCSLVKRC